MCHTCDKYGLNATEFWNEPHLKDHTKRADYEAHGYTQNSIGSGDDPGYKSCLLLTNLTTSDLQDYVRQCDCRERV